MKDHLEWSIKHPRPWYKSAVALVVYGLLIAIGVTVALGYALGEH